MNHYQQYVGEIKQTLDCLPWESIDQAGQSAPPSTHRGPAGLCDG